MSLDLPSKVYAATTPGLGLAADFGILSSTYTNTVGGTTINGDLGYTTGPAMAPTVNGTTHIADGTYTQAGIDQGSALSALASQSCTHTFPAGPVDLATDTSHGSIGVYTPGVYCTTTSSAASIGAGGITLSGSGTYIFRINGAFTTVSSSVVTLSGASACDVFWTPTSATTLGANSTLVGTVIDNSGITIGSTVTWTGRALAFGGTVSTTTDTITVPSCVTPTSTPTPTPGPTSTPTATPTASATPTPTTAATSTSTSSSSSSSSSSSTSIPACVDFAPTNSPNLFQIDRSGSKATLYFTPVNDYLSYYYVAYGLSPGDMQFGVSFPAGLSTGVVNYTINDLNPNATYYFQVRGGNGCMPGGWSNSMESNSKNPSLPNTGMSPRANNTSWDIAILTGTVMLVPSSLVVFARLRPSQSH